MNELCSMFIDILYGDVEPEVGSYIQAVGKHGKFNSVYRVVSARKVQRRVPNAPIRVQMTVRRVQRVPPGNAPFFFTWYPRKRKQPKEQKFLWNLEG